MCLTRLNSPFTFVPHGSDVVEPLFDCGDSVWRVFMSTAGDFSYRGHWTLESATGFCHHSVMTKMEVQSLDYVGGLIFGACEQHKHRSNKNTSFSFFLPSAFVQAPESSFLSPSSQIFCASVQKAMLGSSRWNKAHDLERKFGP